MKSEIMNFTELPVYLRAQDVAKVMGICQRTTWDVIHSEGFPKIKVGRRIIIPKDAFIEWLNKQVGG